MQEIMMDRLVKTKELDKYVGTKFNEMKLVS